MQNKNSQKITSLFLAIFILSVGFLFFGNTKTTQAAGTCSYIVAGVTQTEAASDQNACTTSHGASAVFTENSANPFPNSNTPAPAVDPNAGKASNGAGQGQNTMGNGRTETLAQAQSGGLKDGVLDSCNFIGAAWSPLVCLLIAVLHFAGRILGVAVSLFAWAVDATKLSAILKNDAIFQSWKTVRDFLNIGFILVLLFSAFSTIFQVDKYSYKKILLWLVIMALLVNFSYPITRFIIDVSNSLMYTLLDNSFGSKGTVGSYVGGEQILVKGMNGFEQLQQIIANQGTSASISQLLASIVFVFMLAFTILSMATLFLIRVVALAILIIFSPVAFVGSIIGKGGQWWDYLFKYALFGPVMAFMLALSISIMRAMASNPPSISSGGDNIVTYMASFVIPIVVLWIGMGVAQQMGIAGASMGIANAQGMAKWAGMRFSGFSGAGFVRDTYKAYRSRRDQANEDSWSKKLGTRLGSAQDNFRAQLPGGRDAQIRYEKDVAASVEKASKRNDMANMGTDELQEFVTGGNMAERAAAIQQLIDNNTLDMTNPANAAAYQRMRDDLGVTSQTFNQINNKLKAFDPVSAFAHIDPATRQARMTEYLTSNKFDAKKLGAASLGNANFMQTAFQAGAISNTDLEDLRKKSFAHENNIRTSLGTITGGFANLADTPDPYEAGITAAERDIRLAARRQLEINRSVQIAHFAQTGNVHESIENNGGYMDQIFTRLNKDTMKRISVDTANNYYDRIAQSMPISKYKEAMQNIDNRAAQRNLNANIMATDFAAAGNAEAESLRQAVLSDVRLNNIR